MKHTILLVLLFTLAHAKLHTEEELQTYLEGQYETDASKWCSDLIQVAWDYGTDITPEHEANVTEVTLKAAEFDKKTFAEWFKDVDMNTIKDPKTKRMLTDLIRPGRAALPEAEHKELTDTISRMETIYSSAQICPFDKQVDCSKEEKLDLEPGIEKVLSDFTKSYDEMEYVWTKWHDVSGKEMREHYKKYVHLSNKVGTLNGFKDYGEYWRDSFETENFVEKVDAIWEQVKPFYVALHNYTSRKLVEHFKGRLVVGEDGLLPAHIFGNMWAQSWSNLEKILKPYPDASSVDITAALKEQGYTVKKIFETANDFYTSLGLPTNEVSYGPGSLTERPDDRKVTCHASAWDFCDKNKFLIKMCTEIDQKDFVTVHHEMGHIQYFILYKDQPLAFREGANPGFHEAVGDTIALSVGSIPHLKTIGLVHEDYNNMDEAAINTLMSVALNKIAFLPFGLLIDKWRWDIFSNFTDNPTDKLNEHWWELRKKYQLIKPPTDRDETFFDPGAKYHVAADSQYISYFVSYILQFQFYRGLCIAAGKYNPETRNPPLHECDFYKSKDAGDLLKEGLSLGKSKHWSEVLRIIAGTDQLDACALMEYFNPLTKFLGMQGNISCSSPLIKH